jgi:hypothetical protein
VPQPLRNRGCPGALGSVWAGCWRLVLGDPPGVGEAEAGVAGGAARQCGGEHAGADIVVVVNLGRLLAGMGTKDTPGVLDEASFPPDRGGEEQGVQGRAVEALARIGSGGHDQQRRAARLHLQAGQGRGADLSAQPAAQHDRVVAHRLQCLGQVVQVRDPLGED